VLRAITLGAAGYLLKSAALHEITDGIRDVINGGVPLDKGVARFLLRKLQTKPSEPNSSQLLSERELEVLELLAEGLVKKEIASQLNIRYSTVDTYVARIYEKLNVTNAASAVDRAHRLGIFSSGDAEA
jgi:DNA-binding NarL/FixJ family response regulator